MDNQQLSKECYISMKKLTIDEFEQQVKAAHPKENLKVLFYETGATDAKVQCLTCGNIYVKKGEYFKDSRKVNICKECYPTQTNTLKQDFIPPENYFLIEEYRGMHHKIKVKHETCGFIWKITPSNLRQGKGCPRCNRNVSKGEQKILKWLEENNINYESQKRININEHHLSIDFYLPDFNLYIEYHGEQHYSPINYFGGEDKLKKQQELDVLKVNFFKEKLLVISYLDFDKIEEILKSSTTIPKGSKLEAIDS